jgi:uncharacterized protein (UPF0276 family)
MRPVTAAGPLPAATPGVGLVWWPALAPLVASGAGLVSVVEVEPQAFWELVAHGGRPHYRANEALFDQLAALPLPKLLHGVGHPLCNVAEDPVDPWPLWRQAVDRLDPPWVSEHLSFNRTTGPDGRVESAGFLLPPPQTAACVRQAARRIADLRRRLRRPVAFETGVHYLRPQPHEMGDGEFFAAVSEAADADVLLDLHNLWCNERNGRAPVEAVLAALPLHRVRELHLAGGAQAHGFWLDAHSATVPPALMELAERLLPRLPALGAVIFELLPEHLPAVGLDGVQRQLEQLQALWRRRPPLRWSVPVLGPQADDGRGGSDDGHALAPQLRSLVQALSTPVCSDADPGLRILQGLIADFRRGALARTLRHTLSLLLLGLGRQETLALLDEYTRMYPPEAFAAVEAEQFCQWLQGLLPRLQGRLPLLAEVLAFEQALVRVTRHGTATTLHWSVDPSALLSRLAAGRAPDGLAQQAVTLVVEAG